MQDSASLKKTLSVTFKGEIHLRLLKFLFALVSVWSRNLVVPHLFSENNLHSKTWL